MRPYLRWFSSCSELPDLLRDASWSESEESGGDGVRIQKHKEHEREAAAETDRREVAVSWETGLDVPAGAWLQPVGV